MGDEALIKRIWEWIKSIVKKILGKIFPEFFQDDRFHSGE